MTSPEQSRFFFQRDERLYSESEVMDLLVRAEDMGIDLDSLGMLSVPEIQRLVTYVM